MRYKIMFSIYMILGLIAAMSKNKIFNEITTVYAICMVAYLIFKVVKKKRNGE